MLKVIRHIGSSAQAVLSRITRIEKSGTILILYRYEEFIAFLNDSEQYAILDDDPFYGPRENKG